MSHDTPTAPDWRDQVFETFRRNAVRQVAYVPDAGHSRLIARAHADPDITAYPLSTSFVLGSVEFGILGTNTL